MPQSLCIKLAIQIATGTVLLWSLPFLLMLLEAVLEQSFDGLLSWTTKILSKVFVVNSFIVAALALRESLK